MNSLLNDAQQAALRKALAEPHSAGDHWCGRTVATWMRTRLGKPVSRHSAWRAVGGKHTATKAIWNAILQQHRDRDKDADGGDPSKNIVAAGLADRIELQVSYAIGVARPLSLFVETFGTGKIADEEIIALINQHFDLRPAGIIQSLNLRRPIYQPTAAFGHFGRTDIDLPWERTDKAETLRQAAGVSVAAHA